MVPLSVFAPLTVHFKTWSVYVCLSLLDQILSCAAFTVLYQFYMKHHSQGGQNKQQLLCAMKISSAKMLKQQQEQQRADRTGPTAMERTFKAVT